MDTSAKIEQLHFNSDINVIDNNTYPQVYPLHWHQFAECIAINKPESSATVIVNNQKFTLNSGDILFILPGELHEIVDNTDNAIIALQFPMSLINSKKEFATFYTLYRNNHYIKYEKAPELSAKLMSKISQLNSLFHDKTEQFLNIRMTICLYEMFIDIALHLKDSNNTNTISLEENSTITDKIELACTYIQNHCDKPLTLDIVSSYVGFSPYYFSRLFKKVTTHSFAEYLILQRINTFQIMLTDKNISITEAAYQSGFKSISTLNRDFAKYCGCSPREFRKYYID